MNIREEENGDRDFSVELNSSKHWLSTSSKGARDGVLIQGTLGKLQHASFVEPEILEVRGSNGVLRIFLRKSEISVTDVTSKHVGDEIECD